MSDPFGREIAAPPTKDERERIALESVYDPTAYVSLVHGDRPDFVLQPSGVDVPFGVEITELHYSEAAARLLHHPTYFTDLASGVRRMHPDDEVELGLCTVSIYDKDRNLKQANVPALIRETPPESERSDALAEIITAKAAKYPGYQDGLSHVNLIVFDLFGSGIEPGAEFRTADLLGPALRSALVNQPFGEVFVVEADRNGLRWHRPLRLLQLMESFWLVVGAIDAYGGPRPEIGLGEVAAWFTLLTDLPGVRLAASPQGGGDVACWGRYMIRAEKTTTAILDNHDLPVDARAPVGGLPNINPEVMEPLRAHVTAFVAEQMFHSELWFGAPSKGGPDE